MAQEPTIFIVDDDDAIRDSLELLLDAAGFRNVKTHGPGRSFLDQAKSLGTSARDRNADVPLQ